MAGQILDLSLDIYHGAPTFAWDPKCGVIVHNTIATIGYNITQLSISTHQGTHLDAPFHFLEDGKTVEQLDLQKVIGPAVLIPLEHKQAKEPLTVADFEPYAEHIVPGARVVYRTGWDQQFPAPHYFSDFPYMTVELSRWLAEREIGLIGMDVPTPNPKEYTEVHQVLLGKEIVILEGLARLAQIRTRQFFLMAAPLRIKGRDGSPVRALAMVD